MSSKTPYHAPDGFDWVTRLEHWELDGGQVRATLRTANDQTAALTFTALTPDVWRLTFLPPGVTMPPPTGIVQAPGAAPVKLKSRKDKAGVTVSGARLVLRLEADPWRFAFRDEHGAEVCRENPSDIDGLGRLFILPLGFVRGDAGVTQVTQSFHLRPDEHLFGLGEKFTPLDKRGQRIITWTQDAFGSTSERSHKNIPFLLSTRGYGLLVDSGARITWELGTVSCQSYTAMLEDSALDAYLIYGPAPAEILARYAELTGRAPVPPKWTFGLWLSGAGSYRDRDSHEALVTGAAERGQPMDVLHVDTWWMKWRMYCDFRWDADAFPQVEAWLASLHARGLRVSLWEHPYISVESDLFQIGQENGYFVKRPDGAVYVIDYGLSLAPRPDGVVRAASPENSWNAPVAIIDLSNPAAYAWFQDLHRPVLRLGVDAFKTDFGEDIPYDAVFFNGQTGRTMHNLYPLLYNRAVYEVTQQERGYGVVWARSGTAGNQRYPVCWSGDPAADFDSLACTIRGGLSIGLSGVPFWSNDIGAYRGKPTPHLYVRWAQFGLFCSHSRMHGDSPREPWHYGEEAAAIVRRYTELRYRLFPYLYSAAHEASRTGVPVLRAMPLAFPDDANTFDKDLQYMFGPWLLVAPIYDAGTQRSVYLPAGKWIDFWSGMLVRGPVNLTVTAPLDTLPLFVRAGAIIPTAGAAQRIPQGRISPLIVEVYPRASSAYTLHEDEGDTAFTYTEAEGTLTLEWAGPVRRALVARFNGFGASAGIEVSGGEAEQLPDGVLEVRAAEGTRGRIVVTR